MYKKIKNEEQLKAVAGGLQTMLKGHKKDVLANKDFEKNFKKNNNDFTKNDNEISND
ncbi:MAG: hypothetical protein FWC41_04585 [Firmicutes bacterium]|nr:hypothetical protein [Bacillota bacterium]